MRRKLPDYRLKVKMSYGNAYIVRRNNKVIFIDKDEKPLELSRITNNPAELRFALEDVAIPVAGFFRNRLKPGVTFEVMS